MALKVSRNVDTWTSLNTHVERQMDNASYSAATPEDALVFVGPPRKSAIKPGETSGVGSLLPLGMIQMASIASSQAVQPSSAIGSARKFFLVGSTNHQIQLARLVMNTRNLLRGLMHTAVEAGIDFGDTKLMGSPASYNNRANQQWVINLDSPLFRLPFGLGIILKDRGGSAIGGAYCELCYIQSWQFNLSVGQASVVESTSMTCDRVLPYGNSIQVGKLAVLLDAVLGTDTASEKARVGTLDNISA